MFFCWAATVEAQVINKGHISGHVTDSLLKTPVDFATISIFKSGASVPFNGASADSKGYFAITNLPNGIYIVTIEFLGYKKRTINGVKISDATPLVQLGDIPLALNQSMLKTVNVTGKAPVVENRIDKMVYNAANDLTSQGGVALDVLKKVPMVTVDIDGNVELQGSTSIRFLINGKPSSIFGASLSDALQSIPASQIKNIEVITSPGAKYDANGTGGIINIVLKDSKVQGFNGSVNLSAGTRVENGSVNLNARKGNIGFNAYFNGNAQLNTIGKTTADRTSYNTTRDTITHLLQDGSNSFKRNGFQTGISLNWTLSKHDEFTAAVNFDKFSNINSGLTNQDQTQSSLSGSQISDISSFRSSASSFHIHSTDISAAYKKTFKKEGQELNLLYTSSFGVNSSDASQRQDYVSNFQPSGLLSFNNGKSKETDISLDYAQPVTPGLILEGGLKTIIESLSSNTVTDTLLNNSAYIPNPNQTYGFNYHRNIYAAYVSASTALFNKFLDVKGGLRYERTNTNVDYPGTVIPGYNIFAPSLLLLHKIGNNQSLKASYSYRIERPDYGDVNPFYNISDPHNISTGNPLLRPELGHNYELGYSRNFDKGGNIYIAAIYRYNTDDIQPFTTFYQSLTINGTTYNNVSLTERTNIGSQTQIGLNVFGSVPITNRLNIRSNIQAGNRSNSNPGIATVSAFAYRVNLNISYDFGSNLVGEVFGNYNSVQKNIQGTRPAFGFYNLAFRKLFADKKASIGLTAANPFNNYINQRSTAYGANFFQSSLRQVPYRSFGITFSYKFGKLEFKKDKEENNNQQVLPDQN